jgi:O-antigen ligase
MQILKRIPYVLCLILLAYMPFHIFLSQSLSLATGGLDAWKVGKDVLLCAGVVFTICLVYAQRRATRTFTILLALTVLYGGLHLILWLAHPDAHDRSAVLGTIYNMRLPLFTLLGFASVLLLPKFVFSSAMKLTLIVSTIVAGLGVLQYFLPSDLLTHAGYGLDRGVRAAFFIEDNPDLPRIMSTLREPNALGAYLILPAAAIGALFFGTKDRNKRTMLAGALGLHGLAVFLTFSRSSWLGLALALALVVWWRFREPARAFLRRFWPAVIGVVLVVGFSAFAVRNTPFFQQYVIHSNPEEQVADLDSNDLHVQLIEEGLRGIQDEPLGHGPGTAGLVSIQNPNGTQLTENYYVQIGYEVGIAGALLFIALNAWLYVRIWRRNDSVAVLLCASFWAYVLTNMLLHTWGNEAVAAQWWILAGMALSGPEIVKRTTDDSQKF